MKYFWPILGLSCAFVFGWIMGGFSPAAVFPVIGTVVLAAFNGFTFGMRMATDDWSKLVDRMIILNNRLFEQVEEQARAISKLERQIEVGYEEEE